MAVNVLDWVRQGRAFLQDVQTEAKRVTWLNWRNTLVQTVVALVFIFLLAVYLGVVDVALSRALNYILRLGI